MKNYFSLLLDSIVNPYSDILTAAFTLLKYSTTKADNGSKQFTRSVKKALIFSSQLHKTCQNPLIVLQ